ncbi:MAG: sulfatase-like hydrolase/transferase, partial [Pseudomonadales bacterium]
MWLLSSCDGSQDSSPTAAQGTPKPSAQTTPSAETTPSAQTTPSAPVERPNFLIVVSDDQSWAHTSFAGDEIVRTPAFDRIARDGVYFSNAYSSAPTCTASRSALLSGRHFWQTGPGSTLWGSYSAELPSLQGTLEQSGYQVGYTGKGWGPGVHQEGAITAGTAFNQITLTPPDGISNIDYSANFEAFLSSKPQG